MVLDEDFVAVTGLLGSWLRVQAVEECSGLQRSDERFHVQRTLWVPLVKSMDAACACSDRFAGQDEFQKPPISKHPQSQKNFGLGFRV